MSLQQYLDYEQKSIEYAKSFSEFYSSVLNACKDSKSVHYDLNTADTICIGVFGKVREIGFGATSDYFEALAVLGAFTLSLKKYKKDSSYIMSVNILKERESVVINTVTPAAVFIDVLVHIEYKFLHNANS